MAHHAHSDEPGARHEALPLDPEHDIDARSATMWVVGGAIATFLCLWLMVPIFVRVQEIDRVRKVDQAENAELKALVTEERQILDGVNPTKRSIDDVLRQMAGNK